MYIYIYIESIESHLSCGGLDLVDNVPEEAEDLVGLLVPRPSRGDRGGRGEGRRVRLAGCRRPVVPACSTRTRSSVGRCVQRAEQRFHRELRDSYISGRRRRKKTSFIASPGTWCSLLASSWTIHHGRSTYRSIGRHRGCECCTRYVRRDSVCLQCVDGS